MDKLETIVSKLDIILDYKINNHCYKCKDKFEYDYGDAQKCISDDHDHVKI